ncbi:uncharacterized protein F4812DRAFT_448109 [Daldinia caldariorum]|uniref:uncharacterized protein n=1 Tax=Daldinia caldariorum TaxID=326644 RepID=UPI002008E9DE|nr:uncharacterized protein F4812DRAFT_448109 [Daldinia caldariorum]KAI1463000.1 hypothetical protein F4812DRAFT_448109 [Daldinia caldariorum]
MALSRSASGPGGLSINTSSANLFQQQPAPGGSLFGNASNASTTPKPSLFGNTTTATTTSTATTQPSASSLFGSSSTTPSSQPQQTTSSLFGAKTTPTPQQQGGSLFGSTQPAQAQTQAQAQAPIQPATGLFGGSTTGQSTSTGTGASGGLFGSTTKLSQPAASSGVSSLFAANQKAQSQPQQPGLGLGNSLGLGLTMGQSSTQQTVPGVRIDISNLKGTTRFNDLQEDLQKKIESVDMFIQQQMRNKDEVDSFMPGHKEMLESIPSDVSFVAKKYESAHSALASAAQAIDAARGLVAQDVDHARLSFRAIDNLKLPEQYHTAGIWSPRQQSAGTANAEADGQDLVSFFSKAADDMEDQVKRYDRNMTEIEMHMHGVSDNLVEQLQKMMANKNGAPSGPNEKAQELSAVLRELQQGILKVAGDVAGVRENMTQLQLGNFISNDGDRNGVY